MRLDDKIKKSIEKKVDKYIKEGTIKDESGNIISNPRLVVSPYNLIDFFKSGILLGLSPEEEFYAKQYYKEQMDFKAYNTSRSKDREQRIKDILEFQKLIEEGKIR